MSADTDASEKSSGEKKGTLTLEKIIRRPKYTETEEIRKVVNAIYTRQFASYAVLLIKICPLRNRTIRIDEAKKEISIVDMGTCNKFLDCFAPSITKLKIEYSDSVSELKHRAQFDRIVNKYCAEYVTELTITRAPKEAMMKMKKPFSKVEAVEFVDCNIIGKLADFNECFPNMKKFIISEGIVKRKIDGKCVAKHFPNLEYLRIDIKGPSIFKSETVRGNIEKKHVAEMLMLNPQLRSLNTGLGWDSKFLKEVSKHLQLIESLDIVFFVDNLDSGTIHLKSVKKLNINCFELKKIPLSFDQLEELSLQFGDDAFKQNDIMEFIMKHPTITKLHAFRMFPLSSVMSQEIKLKLAKGLPLLADVNLDCPLGDVIFS